MTTFADIFADLGRFTDLGPLHIEVLEQLSPTPDIFEKVSLVGCSLVEIYEGLTVGLDVVFEEAVAFPFPAMPDFALVMGPSAGHIAARIEVDMDRGGHFLGARLSGPIGLRISRTLLAPARQVDGRWEEDVTRETEIAADVTVHLDRAFTPSLSVPVQFDLGPSLVGGTGLVVSAQRASLGIASQGPELSLASGTLHFPSDLVDPASALTLPDFEFHAVHVSALGFSGSINAEWPLIYDDAAAMFAYHIAAAGGTDVQPAELFGFNGGIRHIGVSFERNQLTGCEITGGMVIPYFAEAVEVRITVGMGIPFALALDGAGEGVIELTKKELLTLSLESMLVGASAEGVAEVSVTGGLEPLLMASDGLEWPKLDVADLAIDTQGRFRIKEAWLDLKDLATLDLFGFHFELNRIGVGYQETDDKLWIDLSGSLRLIEQIPVGLGVEGFRLTWPRTLFEQLSIDGPPSFEEAVAIAGALEVKFDGVYLFFGVPDAVEFEGLIRFIKSAQVVGFAGDIALRVPATGLAAEAGLMVGMNLAAPPYPFLYVYFGIELPAGIPLAQSGLALKGALGLFGLNVAPEKAPEQNWYYDWYKRGPIVGAHPTNKWRNERHALALGVGVTITTVDGYVKGVRGLVVLAIPGPILIIEGRALILNGLLPAEPPLRALAVMDGREKTIQFNIEAEAELIEDMLEAYGMLEAFFDFKDLTNWHLYLGQDEPADRRIRANVLKLGDAFLFKADAYLMVDMIGAQTLRSRMGVYVGFSPPIPDIGPVQITLEAVIEGKGQVTVFPEQFSGQLELSGTVELSAFGFGIQITADASVITEGPKPLGVDVELTVSAEPPDPLEPIEESFAFSWHAPEPPQITSPLSSVTAASVFAPAGGALQIHDSVAVAEPEVWQGAAQRSPVVPLDTRPIVAFTHEMNDAARDPDEVEPAFVRHPDGHERTYDVGLMRFAPSLATVRLYEHRKDELLPQRLEDWRPGLVATSLANDAMGDASPLPGVWMAEADPQDPEKPPSRRLHLWTTNPLLHANAALGPGYELMLGLQPKGTSYAEQLLALHPELNKCAYTKPERICVDFSGRAASKLSRDVEWEHGGLIFTARDGTAIVRTELVPRAWPSSKLQGGLIAILMAIILAVFEWFRRVRTVRTCLVGEGRLSIRFPEPVVRVWIGFCETPKAAGRDPVTSVKTARVARSARERTAIVEEAKAKGVTPDLRACNIPVAHAVSTDAGTWIIEADEAFDRLSLFDKEDFGVAEVCYLARSEAERAARAALQCETNDDNDTDTHNVLRPGSYYCLEVDTKVRGELADTHDPLAFLYAPILEQLGFADTEKRYSQMAFFQTEGPPTAVKRYIKWSSPELAAPRVFCEDDFAIRFLRPSMKRMFGRKPHHLEILVRSAAGQLIRGYKPRWKKARSASLLLEERLWRDHRREVGQPNAAVEADDVLVAQRRNAVLEPKSRYELLLTGGEGGELLFEDAFSDAASAQWQPDTDGWTARDGALTREVDEPALLTAGESTWSDVDVSVEIKLTNGRAAGILVRAGSTPIPGSADPVWNACRVSVRRVHPSRALLRVTAVQRRPASELSARTLLATTIELDSRLFNRVRVSVVADRLRVWVFERLCVDGSLYRVVRDWNGGNRLAGTLLWADAGVLDAAHREALQRGDLLPSTQGQVGLYTGGAGPEFRRMAVRDAVLERVAFTTSAFAGFRELVESVKHHAPVHVPATLPSTHLKAAAATAADRLTWPRWMWFRAKADHRFEALDREGLEEQKLALREARAGHDRAFSALAEAISVELLYRPVADHIELFPLVGADGEVFALWLRCPESLDFQRTVTDLNHVSTGDHVGRTSVSLAFASESLTVDVLHDADSTQAVFFRQDNERWPRGAYRMGFAYQRDYEDDAGGDDHRYDRPVELRGQSAHSENVQITFEI